MLSQGARDYDCDTIKFAGGLTFQTSGKWSNFRRQPLGLDLQAPGV